MHIIEPCCAKKNLMQMRDAMGKNGMTLFEGYGDLSLTELLPALLTRYSEAEMVLVAPSLPDQAAAAVKRWMRRQWARMDGKGKLDVIARLTVITDLSADKSPAASAWLKDNPFPGRLRLVDDRQGETVILMPDFAIIGPVNMQYGSRFTATATSKKAHVDSLWERYGKLADDAEQAAAAGKEEEEKGETEE